MADQPERATRTVTSGGVAGKHPPNTIHPVFVGPSTNGEFNAIEEDLSPEACVRFDDVRFEFDSSFIGPEAATELKLLGQMLKEGPERPASIFGHADPTGDDNYNKILSGRRAQAMYGLLTRKTELWEDIYKDPMAGGDTWGLKSTQTMLKTMGHYNGPINGVMDDATKDAVKAFQGSPAGAGLTVDGDPGPKTREKLFKAYMDAICIDDTNQPFQLDPVKNFLARGADPGGKGDFQGCSEFNPDLIFSQEETNRFKSPANKAERDQENKPNRRVVVYLFRKGSKINPGSWPCPRAKEGVAGCRKRFFSNGEARRAPTATRRLFENTKDTFACRFYDRIGTLSPCESPPPPPPPVAIVTPLVTPLTSIVIVKKPHTNPKRTPITLQTDKAFTGTGTFTVSQAITNAVEFFGQAAGGSKITFDGTDNVFTGAQLTAGHQLFAEGKTPSAALNDVQLTLTLTPGSVQVGAPANATMTSVEVTLDICMSRTAVGVDPTPMPQPPVAPPAAGIRANDKFFGGRFVHAQDAGNHHGRAMLIVRQVLPAAFVGNLTLTPIDAKVQLFQNEDPAAAGAALATPQVIATNTIPAGGLRFFVQGATVSGALVDTGFQLGVQNVEPDGDKVAVTVVRLKNLQADIPSTPANTNRLGNSPVPRHNLIRAAGALAAADFDEDFAANPPLVLVEGSIVAADQIKLSVQVEPINVPVLWSRQRDARPAPNGDHADIIALSPNPLPALTPDGADPLKATLMADGVGSFHIRPFVDCNGTGQFEHNDNTGARIDREPFLIMNLVLVRVQGFTNASVAQPANLSLTPAAPTTATGVGVSTGGFANPAGAGVHNRATVDVIGGGGDGLRGLNSLFGGWINNELASAGSPTAPQTEDVVSNYRDPAPPNAVHPRISAWVQPPAHALFQVFTPPPPPSPALTIQGGPVLDCTNHGAEGTGGNTPVGTEGGGRTPGPPTPIVKNPRPRAAGGGNLGQRWQVEMWDSPGDTCPAAHEGFPAATLTDYRFNLDFRSDLVFWTNITGAPGATGDAACMLYSSVLTNTWTIRFACTFNAAGAVVIGTALTIAMTQDANPTRLAIPAQGSGLEVRAPISLRLLIVDARN